MNKKLAVLKKKSLSLPLTPGVYIMKNKRGEIIYIGKAKALKSRVSQYFGSQNNQGIKVRKMVENVEDFDYILCDSEFEALVLECSLIKQHTPKYNILLKDDKGYSYIKVIEGEFKNFKSVLQKEDDGARYIGPYMSGAGISQAVENAKKIFKIPTCNKVLSVKNKKTRPCLNYSIGQCSAPCAGKISKSAHNEAVERALDYIVNGSEKAIKELTDKMLWASEHEEFERAARYRDTIKAINKITDKQKVVAIPVKEQDVFAIVCATDKSSQKACLSVLRFSDYKLFNTEHFIIDAPEDLPAARHELLRSYYSMRDNIPSKISVDGEVEDKELLSEWLTSLKGKKVTITVPKRGEQFSLLEMCRTNAAQKLALYLGRTGKSTAALDELGTLLGLDAPPQYIESYDISHTAGANSVAGMVVFKNGLPLKRAYKRFAIRGNNTKDDYASMAQVLDRRLGEYEKNKDSEEGFGILPDLILLDGGQGQVNAVLPVLKAHQIDIPVFGMVKDSRHRTRAIASTGEELSLTSKRSAFTLVSTIQEEVHRYAVAYHHSKNKKSTISTTLTSIQGIGETRARALLRHFKTIKAISQASVEELASVKGMNSTSAKSVYDAFRS